MLEAGLMQFIAANKTRSHWADWIKENVFLSLLYGRSHHAKQAKRMLIMCKTSLVC